MIKVSPLNADLLKRELLLDCVVESDRDDEPDLHCLPAPALERLLNAARAEERARIQLKDIRVLAAAIHAAGGTVRITQRHFFDVPRLTLMQVMEPKDAAMVLTATLEQRH